MKKTSEQKRFIKRAVWVEPAKLPPEAPGWELGARDWLEQSFWKKEMPWVCPGCYAVGDEHCASWCPDAELEFAREGVAWRDDRPWDELDEEYHDLSGEGGD